MGGGGGSGLRLILGFFDRRGWVDAGAGLLLIIYFTNNTLILLKENKSQEKQTVFFFFIIEWFFPKNREIVFIQFECCQGNMFFVVVRR